MKTPLDNPIFFLPYYKSVIWGGEAIAALKGERIDIDSVGESWEISAVPGHESRVAAGELAGVSITELMARYGAAFTGTLVAERFGDTFPLLIKLIDARADLSVQVHPDDALAAERHGSPGKTEMWYVVDAAPGSHIYSGLRAPLSPEEYPAAAADGSIMQRIAAHDARPGQFYFIPAGTLHAIGAGTLIAEVQQTSDITYRVFDYNRTDAAGNKRELHTALAADAIDYRFPNPVHPTACSYDGNTPGAVSCRYFNVDYLAGGECAVAGNPLSFTIIMALGGPAELVGPDGTVTRMGRGTTCMLAAAAPRHTLRAQGPTLVITIK